MKKSSLKTQPRLRELLALRRLETGFSMLEAVVVVGVLLALAVGGFLAYGQITENAKNAKVKSAASEVYTGVVAASIDGDASTKPKDVIDNWNASTDKIRVKILPPTEGGTSANGDFCVSATNEEDTEIAALAGDCSDVADGSVPNESGLPVPAGALRISPPVADNAPGKRAISGYGTVQDNSVLTGWGVEVDTTADAETWVQAGAGTSFTLSYYDKDTKEYVDYYTHDMAPDRFAMVVQRGTMVFTSVYDYTSDLTAAETTGFGKMLVNGGKLTFIPENGNGTTKATVILDPAVTITTDPNDAAPDYEESPSWDPLLFP